MYKKTMSFNSSFERLTTSETERNNSISFEEYDFSVIDRNIISKNIVSIWNDFQFGTPFTYKIALKGVIQHPMMNCERIVDDEFLSKLKLPDFWDLLCKKSPDIFLLNPQDCMMAIEKLSRASSKFFGKQITMAISSLILYWKEIFEFSIDGDDSSKLKERDLSVNEIRGLKIFGYPLFYLACKFDDDSLIRHLYLNDPVFLRQCLELPVHSLRRESEQKFVDPLGCSIYLGAENVLRSMVQDGVVSKTARECRYKEDGLAVTEYLSPIALASSLEKPLLVDILRDGGGDPYVMQLRKEKHCLETGFLLEKMFSSSVFFGNLDEFSISPADIKKLDNIGVATLFFENSDEGTCLSVRKMSGLGLLCSGNFINKVKILNDNGFDFFQVLYTKRDCKTNQFISLNGIGIAEKYNSSDVYNYLILQNKRKLSYSEPIVSSEPNAESHKRAKKE
jgi:hypothetical protein